MSGGINNGDKDTKGNTGLYGSHLLRIITATIHLFYPRSRNCGNALLRIAGVCRNGDGKLDVHIGGRAFCRVGVCAISRHESGAACRRMDQVRISDAEKVGVQSGEPVCQNDFEGRKINAVFSKIIKAG